MTDTILHIENVSKLYPGTKALSNVNFDLKRGVVNVLVGENGAGKSTMMKIIAGIEQPTSGKILLEGEEVSFKDTTAAREKGIGIIHQELNLFPELTMYQNIFMANEKTNGLFVDNKTHIELAEKVLQRLEMPIDVRTKVGELRVGQQQIIEIAKNLAQENLKILIMDEPTSSLSNQEVQVLFRVMKDLLAQGISIVYISHRLEEIMEIGDYISVLHDGHLVATSKVKEIDIPWIVRNMLGDNREYPVKNSTVDFDSEEDILSVENLTLPKKGGGYYLDKVSFNLKKGEVLGLYGLLGAGRTEVFECIMGLRPEHTGTIKLHGKVIKPESVAKQIENHLALVPEDRQREGVVQTMNIAKNASLSSLKRFAKNLFINKKEENACIDEQIRDLHIKVADKALSIMSLSGGNQQKVVFGKAMMTQPEILLLDEPSRGIDVGAKIDIFEIINNFTKKGVSVIVISSKLKEVIAMADRVVVLSNGKITGNFKAGEIKEENLVLASYKGHGKDKTEE